MRGKAAILFTCPTRMERKACHEAWELLSEKVDEEQESSPQTSLAASLKAEAKASKTSKVATYDLGSQGVGWATVDGVDVVELATRLVRDAADDPASLAAGSRMVIRIMPMQSVTFASLSDLVEGAAPLISQSFGGLRTSPHRAIVEALESMKTRDEELLKTAREKAAADAKAKKLAQERAAAEVKRKAELERERRDERRADASPGAENRRRRRRERAEVAAKLDATEARLSAMRLEDARKARAKADSVTEASRRAPRGV